MTKCSGRLSLQFHLQMVVVFSQSESMLLSEDDATSIMFIVHGTSELRDKLVFILVHDEVIIKLPQNIGGIIITISLSAHSQHEVTELTPVLCLLSVN